MKIGIITLSDMGTTSKIVEAAQERGHEVLLYNPQNIMIKVSNSVHGYDDIYSTTTGEKLQKPDIVLWRAGGSGAIGLALLRFFIERGIRCSHNPTGILNCADKFLTHQLLSKNRSIRNPESILTSDLAKWTNAANKIDYPLFIKENKGSQGKTVYYAKDEKQGSIHVKHLQRAGVKKLIFQEFINTGDEGVSDYRVFIVNSVIVAIMKRSGNTHEMIANISQGAKGEKGEISEENAKMCLEAADAIGMQNSITGIDLLIDNENGNGYIIEGNSNPGLKIEKLTGEPVSKKIIEWLEELAELKPSEVPENNRTFAAKVAEAEKLMQNGHSIHQLSPELRQAWAESKKVDSRKQIQNF